MDLSSSSTPSLRSSSWMRRDSPDVETNSSGAARARLPSAETVTRLRSVSRSSSTGPSQVTPPTAAPRYWAARRRRRAHQDTAVDHGLYRLAVEAQFGEDGGPILSEEMGDLRDARSKREHAGRSGAAIAAHPGVAVGYHEAVADALRVGQEEVVPGAGVGADARDAGPGERLLPLGGGPCFERRRQFGDELVVEAATRVGRPVPGIVDPSGAVYGGAQLPPFGFGRGAHEQPSGGRPVQPVERAGAPAGRRRVRAGRACLRSGWRLRSTAAGCWPASWSRCTGRGRCAGGAAGPGSARSRRRGRR